MTNGNGNINRIIILAVAGLAVATLACAVLISLFAPSQTAQIPGLMVASAAVNVGLFNMRKIYKNDETTNVVLRKVGSVQDQVDVVERQGAENQKVLDGRISAFLKITNEGLAELKKELQNRQELGQHQGERKGREETEARISGSNIAVFSPGTSHPDAGGQGRPFGVGGNEASP